MRLVLFICLIACCIFSILINESTFMNPFTLDTSVQMIIFDLRLPRVILAVFIGAALSNIGWTYQIHFKNELATPYTLGISSVAALSLAISQLLSDISITLNKDVLFLLMIAPLFYIFYKIKAKNMRNKVLLLGMGIGIFSSSLIVLAQTLLGNESVARLVHWMMGSLNIVGMKDLLIVIPIIVIFLLYSFFHRKRLGVLSVGEDFAFMRGINTEKVFIHDLLITSITLCSIIWIAGPIGFVGLVIPQVVKRVWSANYANYMVHSALLGALFLVICDFISRVALAQIQLPIGAITAVVGAPMLIYFIVKSKY